MRLSSLPTEGAMQMKRLYLILAVLGAIIPYLFFIQYFSTLGLSLGGFISAVFANGATAGFTVDLLFTSFVFWSFMFIQKRDHSSPSPYLSILLNLTIGLSCALPANLYAREV
jgi:hypothetical protein